MSFTVEKLEHSMAKLTITVPAADFDKAMTAAYNKTKNRFNVPGSVRARCQWHSSRRCMARKYSMRMLQMQ